jgi:hypothetical protein
MKKANESIANEPPPLVQDERTVRPSKENRIDLADLDETVRAVRSRVVDLKTHQENPIRLAEQVSLANEELRKYVGKEVSWKFTVSEMVAETRLPPVRFREGVEIPEQREPGFVRVTSDWYATDGERMPTDLPNHERLGGRLIRHTVFQAMGFPENLVVGKHLSQAFASRLNIGDRLTLTGTIESLEFDGTPPFLTCRLKNVKVKDGGGESDNSDKTNAKKCADAFVLELKANMVAAAYRMTTADYRQRVSEEQFTALVEQNLREIETILMWDCWSAPGNTYHRYVVSMIGPTHRCTVFTVKEGAAWKVAEFTFGRE